MERFKKILLLVIVLLLGVSTGSSYARSLFSDEVYHSSDGLNSVDSKKAILNICLFSSEIEDVSEESSDDEPDSNEDFYLVGSIFLDFSSRPALGCFFLRTPSSLQFFTKFSRFIFFRNIRI